MARINLLVIKIEETKKNDYIDTLAKAFGYNAVIVDINGTTNNPVTKEDYVKGFVRKMLHDEYRAQKAKELQEATQPVNELVVS